jgi:hypothetical protein
MEWKGSQSRSMSASTADPWSSAPMDSGLHRDELETADESFAKAVNQISQMMKDGTLSKDVGKHKLCQVFTEMAKVAPSIMDRVCHFQVPALKVDVQDR